MVKYGFEDWKDGIMPGNPPTHLVIYTNEITEEVLDGVDTEKTPNIIFAIPRGCDYRVIELQVDLFVWKMFAQHIESLAIRGTLVDKQFTAAHFEGMTQLRYLSIGATSYPLFEDEDISNVPVIKRFYTGGYGVVKTSESLQLWQRKLKLNEEVSPQPPHTYYHLH